MLLATAVTVTTPTDEMVDVITRALRPFRRLGVNPDAVALAFSMMLRAIPATAEIADETRQAARARGLERSPRARLTPLVIRVVARARMTGRRCTPAGSWTTRTAPASGLVEEPPVAERVGEHRDPSGRRAVLRAARHLDAGGVTRATAASQS